METNVVSGIRKFVVSGGKAPVPKATIAPICTVSSRREEHQRTEDAGEKHHKRRLLHHRRARILLAIPLDQKLG